jgi:ribonuclease D
MKLITTTAELADICTHLAKEPYVSVDTEFMRESTYFPKLCLIQMACPSEGWLIDPIAPELDLAPFFTLMTHEPTVKVFHSGRQDLEIIWLLGQVIPSPVFDTQIAAMVCGYGDQVSYEQLARDFAKAKIDKSHRYTDWSRRPLHQNQLTYALGDVTHLCKVYEGLLAKLEENNRSHWLKEEIGILTDPSTYDQKPENAWMRFAGRLNKPRELVVLRELAIWRDREARNRDVPRARILKDDTLLDVATSAPRTEEAMGELRSIPKGFERSKSGGDILECVQRALESDPAQWPTPLKGKHRAPAGSIAELLKVLLKAIAEQEGVAAKIIANSDMIEELARNDDADIAPLKGWRRELFGQYALALKRGELAITYHEERVQLITLKKNNDISSSI